MSLEQSGMILGAFVLALITVVVVVVLWRGMEVARTQIAADKDKAYLRLAEEATEFQRRVAEEQKKSSTSIEDIQQRLASIEKMLKEVG
jgi:uncharacterized membrane protein YhiD involved in acid resistance